MANDQNLLKFYSFKFTRFSAFDSSTQINRLKRKSINCSKCNARQKCFNISTISQIVLSALQFIYGCFKFIDISIAFPQIECNERFSNLSITIYWLAPCTRRNLIDGFPVISCDGIFCYSITMKYIQKSNRMNTLNLDYF